ncbi:MAG: nicotinate (nicotinamide) nucleotide adenylyltransferase [Planctomycetota bacterium]
MPARGELSLAARHAQRLGLFGGSFDPPHLGHLHVVRRARAAFALDHVVLVPAAEPPHKLGQPLSAGALRLELLQKLLAGEEGVSLWSVELERAGPSYTIDTLRALRKQAQGALFLIVGTDNLEGLPGWREAEAVLALAQPIVVPRAGTRAEAVAAALADERLSARARTRLALGRLTGPTVDVSSSELRAALARGAGSHPLLPEAVAAAVRAHGLYRAP